MTAAEAKILAYSNDKSDDTVEYKSILRAVKSSCNKGAYQYYHDKHLSQNVKNLLTNDGYLLIENYKLHNGHIVKTVISWE